MQTKEDNNKVQDVIYSIGFSNFNSSFFIPCGFYTLHKINMEIEDEEEKKEKKPERERSISAFDIETNGREVFIGSYDGKEYKYIIIRKPTDVINALNLLTRETYFYGDYDLPVILSTYVTLGNFAKIVKKKFGENFFFSEGLSVRRFKNYYKIRTQNNEMHAINLLQFYSESLYGAYLRFYDKMRDLGFEVFDQETLKEWKQDKEKRENFDQLDFNDTNTVNEIARYNKLDVVATLQLAQLKEKLFGISMKSTLPATSISYILNQVRRHHDTRFITGLKKHPLVEETLRTLYRGGLFDSNELGKFKKVYKYDVNSMYPYFMTLLPELEFVGMQKEFEVNEEPILRGTQFNEDAKYVYIHKITLKQTKKYVASKHGGMLLRTGYARGSFFDFELADEKHEIIPDVDIRGEYSTIKFRITKHRLFKNVIEDIYSKRLQFKKEKNPIEKVYKLILNSSYGKFAERIGFNSKFQNIIYAGMITGMGRTYIQNVDPSSVSYLTDSVISKKPIRDELVGDNLGQLKMEGEGDAIVVGNGQYLLNDEKEKMVKLRGFNISEDVAEKIITYMGNELVRGKIVRVLVPTKIMVRNLFQYSVLSQDRDILMGILTNQDKVISPLNIKQKYVYHGNWVGKMYENYEEFDTWKKDFKKRIQEIEPIDLNSITS